MTSVQKLVCLEDYEAPARAVMTEAAFEYVASGAGSEQTLRANRTAFQAIPLLPHVLRDVSRIDTRVELFGREHRAPILLAPAGYHRLAHPRGELETIDGANLAGCTVVASSFATVAIEEVQQKALRPHWFQLYAQKDRGHTREMLARVVDVGCEAICLTVDLPVNASRDRETRISFELPPGMVRANLMRMGKELAGAAHSPVGHGIYNAVRAADLTWKDIEWIRSITSVPLLLKGILRADDARAAVGAGCAGLIVSNHGGRGLDGVPATIEVLPRIADAVGNELTLLLDGGVRRGTDVAKALAYGAKAVLIGRPYLYGLALGGAAGVAEVVRLIATEFEVAMGLLGCSRVSEIDRTLVEW